MRSEWVKKLGGVLLALLVIAAASYVSFSSIRESGLRELHDKAERRLSEFSATLFAPMDKYSYLPAVVAMHPLAIEVLRHRHDRQLLSQANTLLDHVNNSAKSAVVYILDGKGQVVAASNWQQPESFVGQNYAFRPYFQDAMREGSGRFYGIGMTSLMPGYYLAHAIRDASGVLGVAVVKVELSDLDAGWHRSKSGDEFIVTDENGVIFLSSRAEWKYRPMTPLAAQAKEQVRRTHQYDAVLKEQLPLTVTRQLRTDERLVDIRYHAPGAGDDREANYLLKSAPLAGSDWTVSVLIPTEEADLRAKRTAGAVAGVLAFFMLAVMYVQQVRRRNQEREKSRLELELTHKALEQQHSELQKLTEELRISAITDPLTGAYNRRFFFETIGKLVSTASRHQSALSIVTIDVDHFKRINDQHGHPAGDTVLRVLTATCKESLREADVFARFGGEEFIMALPNSDSAAAYAVAERLRIRVMEREIEIRGQRLHITLSCGVAQYRPPEGVIDETLKRADEALYEAKNGGRNRVVVR